jgi:hypothetical protein
MDNPIPPLQAIGVLLGKLVVPIKATFKLDEIKSAHREYASGSGMGSIIIEVAS